MVSTQQPFVEKNKIIYDKVSTHNDQGMPSKQGRNKTLRSYLGRTQDGEAGMKQKEEGPQGPADRPRDGPTINCHALGDGGHEGLVNASALGGALNTNI